MKISRKNLDLEEFNTKKINSWGKIQYFSEFEEYYIDSSNLLITATIPKPTSEYFFNKKDTLQTFHSLGKNFYKIYESLLKENYKSNKNNKTKIKFIDLDNMYSDIKDNYFINSFLPVSILKEKPEYSNLVLKYCSENGMPLNYDEDQYPIDEDDINSSCVTEYFCLIQPFIAISMLIYIFNSLQLSFKRIFDGLEKEIKITENTTFEDILNSSEFDYYLSEHIHCVENFLWFLDTEENNINKISIIGLCKKFCDTFNSVNNSTAYLGFKNIITFSTSDQRFYHINNYSSIVAMAWECLYNNILSLIAVDTVSYFKTCKSCGEDFFTDDSKEDYCSDYCKSQSNNKKSKRSYDKAKLLLEQLNNIFLTLTETQLLTLSKNKQALIHKFVNLSPTDFKKNKIKSKNKMKELENALNIVKKLANTSS